MTELKIEKWLFLLAFLFTWTNILAQDPLIQRFTTADGLPSNGVYTVFQGSNKFLWFATDAGVSKYDGTKFINYRKQDGLSSNDVFNINEDSFGRVWFFHVNASLNYYFQNTIHNEKNTPILGSLKSDYYFRKFYEDEDRNVYFYFNPQLLIYRLDSQNHITKYKIRSIHAKHEALPRVVEGMSIHYMRRDASGEFYFWTSTGNYTTKDLNEQPVLLSNKYKFRDIISSSNNRKYIITRRLNSIQYEVKRFNNESNFDKIESLYNTDSENISSILEDNNGLLWISTYDKGVFCIKDKKIIYHFDIKYAKSVIQDHEDNIWICSLREGVYKINPFFTKYQHLKSSAFQYSGVFALGKNDSTGVWCSIGKMIYLLRGNNLLKLDFHSSENSFNQVVQLNSTTLFVGEINRRPYILEGIHINMKDKKVQFDKESQSPVSFNKLIVNEQTNEMCSFTQYNLILLDPKQFFKKLSLPRIGEQIFSTFYNLNNELIVNARKNYIYADFTKKECNEITYFRRKVIKDHLNLSNKAELFNIEGDSLFLLKDKKLMNLSAAFEQPIDLQINHLIYHDSTLFIATSRNVFVCENPLHAIKTKTAKFYMINIDFKSINDILLNGNNLYIASDEGLTSIPFASLLETKNYSPIPYFQSIQVNDQENLVNQNGISIVSDQRINIAFSCINYSTSPITFSYKLEGIDMDWTIVKGNNVVLQNLSKGKYIFKLRARKPASNWSEPAEFGIEARATIWEHPMLYFFVALLIAGLIFLAIIRRKNVELDRRKMENQLLLMEQKSLQALMNPHFIFNTLGSIQNYLLHNKPYEAGIYLSQFARLIRQNLNSMDASMINLEEEVDRLKNYLDLEKLRMGDKFEYLIEIDDEVESEDILVPSMIIQPFVENAIWHGIANLDQKGFIGIFISLKNEKSIQIIIEDSGIGILNSAKFNTRSEQHLNLGMNITKKRLTLLSQKYGVETNISYSERSPGAINPGTKVSLLSPFLYGKSNEPS